MFSYFEAFLGNNFSTEAEIARLKSITMDFGDDFMDETINVLRVIGSPSITQDDSLIMEAFIDEKRRSKIIKDFEVRNLVRTIQNQLT